jgi:DNA-binding response OmpR family regulator
VLDVMLPKRDGFAVVRSLRDHGIATPVLMLTARDAVADKVAGLDLLRRARHGGKAGAGFGRLRRTR